jgi:hypothetical protein
MPPVLTRPIPPAAIVNMRPELTSTKSEKRRQSGMKQETAVSYTKIPPEP